MNPAFSFSIQCIRFDENYHPAEGTRITTNFANLARGASRQENLRKALRMIDSRFNSLASWDNPSADRYALEIDIVCAEMQAGSGADVFPLIEMLQTCILDKKAGKRIDGVVGNNFSSYVRDYDFSIVLPQHKLGRSDLSMPSGFGELHGKLFKQFLNSAAYRQRFRKPPVICLSLSSSQTYRRNGNCHPTLGIEYLQSELSLTDRYFEKMGMQVRFFMPPGSVAPLAFYFMGDLLADYTDLELISAVSTMETFQKIYRPEIYNANAAAAGVYRPSLQHQDYSVTQIVYDREERRQLAAEQGKFAEERLIKPYGHALAAAA